MMSQIRQFFETTTGCVIFCPPNLSLDQVIIALIRSLGSENLHVLTVDPSALIQRCLRDLGERPALSCFPLSVTDIPPRGLVVVGDLDLNRLPYREIVTRRPVILLRVGINESDLTRLDHLAEISFSEHYACPYNDCQSVSASVQDLIACPVLPLDGVEPAEQTLTHPIPPNPLLRLRVGSLIPPPLVFGETAFPLPSLLGVLADITESNLILAMGTGLEVMGVMRQLQLQFARYDPERSRTGSAINLEAFLKGKLSNLVLIIPPEGFDVFFNWPALPGINRLIVVGNAPYLVKAAIEAIHQTGLDPTIPSPYYTTITPPLKPIKPTTLTVLTTDAAILDQLKAVWYFFTEAYSRAQPLDGLLADS